MTPDNLAEFLSDPQLHPRFLELIARVHAGDPVVAELVVWHPAVTDSTRKALEGAPADSPIGEAESEGDEEEDLKLGSAEGVVGLSKSCQFRR